MHMKQKLEPPPVSFFALQFPRSVVLDAVALAREDAANEARIERVLDALHAGVGAHGEEEEARQDDDGVERHGQVVEDGLAADASAAVGGCACGTRQRPRR